MPRIEKLVGLEILDSRGRPTVQAQCYLEGGVIGIASVPSGASTGTAEAWELRDGDQQRFAGLGCRQAVAHIETVIDQNVRGRVFASQRELDERLIALDGTPNKAHLGANAVLAVSLAFACAAACEEHLPLYDYFAQLIGGGTPTLPHPMINLFSGGKHAGGQVAIQDVLIIPLRVTTMSETLAMAYAVYQAAARSIAATYGARALTADEGGLAPPCASSEAMIADAVTAIEQAGLVPGIDVALAVDVAASHFYHEGRYLLDGQSLTSPQMIERLSTWMQRYPIISVEDGLAQEDWGHWPALLRQLQQITPGALVVGDDLLCTNPGRVARAVTARAANTLLLKVNQIGTLTEAAATYRLARAAGWQIIVSARSGETEDTWLADLAVGWNGDYIKVGSITQSERLAKYNRLLALAQMARLPFAHLSQ